MKYFVLFCLVFGLSACAHSEPVSQEIALASGKLINPNEFNATLEQAAKSAGVKGFSIAIINDAKIVHHANIGLADLTRTTPVSNDTLFEMASMSKPLFGALVVELASDGLIDLDKPLADYLPHPDLSDDPRAQKISARHVLTHQSGLPNWRTDNPDKKLDIAFEPGSSRQYSGEGYEYLADVMMHILNTDDQGLDTVFQKRIAGPAGAQDTAFVQNRARVERKAIGYFKGKPFAGDTDYTNDGFGAAYSVHSTAKDYAQIMIGLMGGPSLNAEQREQFFAPQNVSISADDPDRALGLTDQALGYAIYDLPPGRFFVHGGNNEGFSGISAMQPDKGWGFVMVSNENQATSFQLATIGLLLGLEGP